MTDTQMFTLAMAVLVPLSLLLLSNSRVTDAKETLRADIRALSAEIKALSMEMNAGLARMSLEIQSVRHELKIHELEHHK